ncbi:hypothetical protein HWV62_21874 [Athelia sp. TMB]|nr:hypothetical protein HWV62_21874 [Athelia sp. TMB]
MASLLRAYNAALIRRPYAASMATSAVLFGGGDLIAQQAIEKKGLQAHDWARTARLTFYGGVFFGPAMTKWYQILNRIKFLNPTKATIYRVALDQGVLTPGVVAFFFTSMTFLEGKGVNEAKERLEKAYQPTLLRNWCVFVPTQIINFALVPHHLRFVVVSVVSLFWNTYLSAVNAQQTAVEDTPIEAEMVKLQ